MASAIQILQHGRVQSSLYVKESKAWRCAQSMYFLFRRFNGKISRSVARFIEIKGLFSKHAMQGRTQLPLDFCKFANKHDIVNGAFKVQYHRNCCFSYTSPLLSKHAVSKLPNIIEVASNDSNSGKLLDVGCGSDDERCKKQPISHALSLIIVILNGNWIFDTQWSM